MFTGKTSSDRNSIIPFMPDDRTRDQTSERRERVPARITLHDGAVYVEVEDISEPAIAAVRRALEAARAEFGDGAERHGPFTTFMVAPPQAYGSIRPGAGGKRLSQDHVIAARAAARAVLREAGYTVSW